MNKARPDEYIKTDRNGTQYFRSWKCPHCGGEGRDRAWSFTGFTCWKCNGTGEVAPYTVKVHTPEYEAILNEKNRQKREKKIADKIASYQADMRKAYREVGFNDDGYLYIVTEDDTYSIKEDLKKAGARWFPTIGKWGFKQDPQSWKTYRIQFDDFYYINEYAVVCIKGNQRETLETLLKAEEICN